MKTRRGLLGPGGGELVAVEFEEIVGGVYQSPFAVRCRASSPLETI
jgi:hypothetical protein